MASAVRTWDRRYDDDARAIAEFTAARIEAALAPGRLDCEVSFERIPLSTGWRTNPKRGHAVRPGGYPALRQLLGRRGDVDSVPLVAATLDGPPSLWDGHRRLETYRAAGRPDVPSWHVRFRPGVGRVSVSATPAPAVGTGTGSG